MIFAIARHVSEGTDRVYLIPPRVEQSQAPIKLTVCSLSPSFACLCDFRRVSCSRDVEKNACITYILDAYFGYNVCMYVWISCGERCEKGCPVRRARHRQGDTEPRKKREISGSGDQEDCQGWEPGTDSFKSSFCERPDKQRAHPPSLRWQRQRRGVAIIAAVAGASDSRNRLEKSTVEFVLRGANEPFPTAAVVTWPASNLEPAACFLVLFSKQGATRTLAKQLVQLRAQKDQLYSARARIAGVGNAAASAATTGVFSSSTTFRPVRSLLVKSL